MGTVTISTEEYRILLCRNCNKENIKCKEEVKEVEKETEENGYIVFTNIEQIEKYYNANTNTYEFKKNGILIHIKFEFDLDIKVNNIKANNIKANNIDAYNIDASNIKANNIYAYDIDASNIDASNIKANNIDAYDIDAYNIDAYNIDANNISYYAYCIAYKSLICLSIKGIRENSIHKCLDKEIEYIT